MMGGLACYNPDQPGQTDRRRAQPNIPTDFKRHRQNAGWGGPVYPQAACLLQSAEANNEKVSGRTIAGNYLETKKHLI